MLAVGLALPMFHTGAKRKPPLPKCARHPSIHMKSAAASSHEGMLLNIYLESRSRLKSVLLHMSWSRCPGSNRPENRHLMSAWPYHIIPYQAMACQYCHALVHIKSLNFQGANAASQQHVLCCIGMDTQLLQHCICEAQAGPYTPNKPSETAALAPYAYTRHMPWQAACIVCLHSINKHQPAQHILQRTIN